MEEITLFTSKHERTKWTAVHENTDVPARSPLAAAVHSVAGLCSSISGAVKVFINKKT